MLEGFKDDSLSRLNGALAVSKSNCHLSINVRLCIIKIRRQSNQDLIIFQKFNNEHGIIKERLWKYGFETDQYPLDYNQFSAILENNV